mgnify:CR=1 FL=1
MNDAAIIDRETAAATGTGTGLSVVSIAKSYDKRSVLSDVSLAVGRGEVVGLLGPNGAGKTTCFYSIMGLVKPDAGRIELDGQDITDLPMYRRAIMGLGYLPQETSIFRGLSVEQNIQAVLELAEPDKSARAARLEQLLDEFGLTRLRASAAMALSGGERRRCEIARALAARPRAWHLAPPCQTTAQRSCPASRPSPRATTPSSSTSGAASMTGSGPIPACRRRWRRCAPPARTHRSGG